MKKVSNICLLLLIPLMMSCASNIRTKKYVSKDLTSYKTFACFANSSSFKADEYKTASNTPIEQSLISLINANMTVKGFTVNESEPDMLIFLAGSNQVNQDPNEESVEGGSSQGPNFASSSSALGYRRYSSNSDNEIINQPHKNGELLIEIFDRESKELLWTGIAKDFKSHISDQTLMARMIAQVFDKFPK
jgi:hypothetical protein